MDWVSKRLGFGFSSSSSPRPPPRNANAPSQALPPRTRSEENDGGTLKQNALRSLVVHLTQALGNRNEKERDAQASMILADFCKLFGNGSISVRDSWESGMDDLRKFAALVCRRLIGSVQHHLDRQAGEDLFHSLTSQHLQTLKALEILSSVTATAMGEVFVQNHTASICMRMLHLLASLPAPAQDEENVTTVAHSLTAILKNLSHKDQTAPGVSISDLVEILVRSQNQGSAGGSPIWRASASQVLQTVVHDRINDKEVNMIHANQAVKSLIDNLANCVDAKDPINGATILDSAVEIMKASCKISSVLIDDFSAARGYDAVTSLLGICAAPSVEHEKALNAVIPVVEELLYVGKEDIAPSVTEQPYQHADFKLPSNVGTGPGLRNLDGLQVFTDIFIGEYYKLPKTRRTYDPLLRPDPEKLACLEQRIINTLLKIFRNRPLNYFLSEKMNIVFTLIQNLDRLQPLAQQAVMDVCYFVLTELNYVPFKELVFLLPHFHGPGTPESSELVCDMCLRVLHFAPTKFAPVLREVGILNALTSVIQDTAAMMNINASPKSAHPAANEMDLGTVNHELVFSMTSARVFNLKMNVLAELLEDKNNVAAFRKVSKGCLFDVLYHASIRGSALKVISRLIKDAVATESKDMGDFARLIEVMQSAPRLDMATRLDILHVLKETLTYAASVRNAFRENGGFVALVSILLALEGSFGPPPGSDCQDKGKEPRSPIDAALALSVIRALFAIFIESIQDHNTNRLFVREQIGIQSIQDGIRLTGILNTPSSAVAFGGLLGLALENVTVINMFTMESEFLSDSHEGQEADSPRSPFKSPTFAQAMHLPLLALETLSNPTTTIQNPKFLVSALMLLPHADSTDPQLACMILESLYSMSVANKHNQVKMNNAGLLYILFEWLYEKQKCWFLDPSQTLQSMSGNGATDDEVSAMAMQLQRSEYLVTRLAKRLTEVGVSDTELRYLFAKMDVKREDDEKKQLSLMDLILHGLKHGRTPCYISFDMNVSDQCCLWINDFGRPFPPMNGYTFMAWVRVERFDPRHDIPILSIIDDDEKYRLLVSIENGGSRRLKLQTFKTVVLFDGFIFQENEWYHFAIVHQKPRISNSYADVYINGKSIQHLKCPYLGHPGSASRVRTIFNVPTEHKVKEKRRFVWSLGPSYFFEEILLDAPTVSAIYNIGFDYFSNFQGSLAKYQTNEMIRDLLSEAANKSKDKAMLLSDQLNPLNIILPQAKNPVGTMQIPEEKLLFAICPQNDLETISVHRENERSTMMNVAGKFLPTSLKAILNSAVPKLRDELDRLPDMAYIKGEALVVCPQRMVDGIWKLGGCSILLKLIEKCPSSDALEKACSVLVESLRSNWRNTEEMERSGHYEILAILLKEKKEMITTSVMDVLLSLVGRDQDNNLETVLTNVSAYRHLFLDFELWQNCSPEIQTYHIRQFFDFVTYSARKEFNIKRLHKMGIVKRFLGAIRYQPTKENLLSDILSLLKVFVQTNFTPEVVRALCTFLVSTLPKDGVVDRGDGFQQPQHKQTNTTGKDQPSVAQSIPRTIMDAKTEESQSYNVLIRNSILELLLEVMSESQEHSARFATSITTRWVLLFFERNLHPYTVVLTSRIFARMMVTQDAAYASRFRDGFVIMAGLLSHYHNVRQLYHALFAVLCGTDISRISMDAAFDLPSLLAMYKPADPTRKRNGSSDVLRVILSMAKATVESISENATHLKHLSELQKPTVKTDEAEGDITLANSAKIEHHQKSEYDTMRDRTQQLGDTLETVFTFLAEIYRLTEEGRDYICRPEIMDDIVAILFSVVCPKNSMSLDQELSAITAAMRIVDAPKDDIEMDKIDGDDFVQINPAKKTYTFFQMQPTSETAAKQELSGILRTFDGSAIPNSVKTSVRQFVVFMSLDSILGPWKPLRALDLILKGYPPAPTEPQLQFQSFIMLNVMTGVSAALQRQKSYLTDARVLGNLMKFCTLVVDRVFQGNFVGGGSSTFELLVSIIEQVQGELERQNKTDLSLPGFYRLLNRVTLYRFGHVRTTSMGLWKLMLLQKPTHIVAMLKSSKGVEHKELVDGFSRLLEMDLTTFTSWMWTRKDELNGLFSENATRVWDVFVATEYKNAKEAVKLTQNRRAARLRKLVKKIGLEQDMRGKYISKSRAWVQEIQRSEQGRYFKQKQDAIATRKFVLTKWDKASAELERERAIWGPQVDPNARWKLDLTEGKSRMRKRMQRNNHEFIKYLSKAEKQQSNPAYDNFQQLPPGLSQSPHPRHGEETPSNPPTPAAAHATLPSTQTENKESGTEEDAYLDDLEIEEEIKQGEFTMEAEIVDSVGLESTDSASSSSTAVAQTQKRDSTSQGGASATKNLAAVSEEVIDHPWEQESKVLRLIEQGDGIVESYNAARIVGMDVCGEFVDVDSVPPEERNVYNVILTDQKENPKKFEEKNAEAYSTRDSVCKILSKAPASSANSGQTENISGIANTDNLGSRLRQKVFGGSPLEELTQKWCQRDISNFEYLMRLNSLAGRSYHDLTQYPVFPWILSDYESEELDLEDAASFRDLSKPMGAQGKERAEKFIERYSCWDDPTGAPGHYAVHYSSAMIVCAYLIRLEPFTQQYLKLQGGHFDHPDRLFHSIAMSWKTASQLNMADVRELIPEFFYLPEFLMNSNNFDFGTNQKGEKIDNVVLPAWAHGDPKIFIQKHREALESEYVSAHLHEWIDLIFGYKQQGEEAVKGAQNDLLFRTADWSPKILILLHFLVVTTTVPAINVFHYLSYEGAVDIDAIEDPVQKQATVGIINNFGQSEQ
ncbi:hypothetical protein HK102_013434 [Quaeritorhiza haematococci]|nr:hypothetical protein HK102_013434 [Quaeritorhiza haematococci]